MARKAVYTVITGGYDTLKEPFIISKGWEYICFTDDLALSCSPWEIRIIDRRPGHEGLTAQRIQRRIKILAHEYLPEFDYTVYMDGSTVQMRDFNELIDTHYRGEGMLLKRHHRRKCVYEEVAQVIKLGKDTRSIVIEQQEKYRDAGYPSNNGMYETGIMLRANTPTVNALCDFWYAELAAHSVRDQISLPYALHLTGLKPKVLDYAVFQQFIRIKQHASAGNVDKPRIWYFQPFAADKNIGKEYNHYCSIVPDNDWICITDHDSMWLHPHTKKQLEDIIAEQGNKYDLLGCLTNRLASAQQCYNGKLSDDPNILNHYGIAEELYNNNYAVVTQAMGGIAGLLMLMPKKTWERIKFQENDIAFDTTFCRKLLIQHKGKIGIMQGVYLFHYYRFHQPNPKHYKEHLK